MILAWVLWVAVVVALLAVGARIAMK